MPLMLWLHDTSVIFLSVLLSVYLSLCLSMRQAIEQHYIAPYADRNRCSRLSEIARHVCLNSRVAA